RGLLGAAEGGRSARATLGGGSGPEPGRRRLLAVGAIRNRELLHAVGLIAPLRAESGRELVERLLLLLGDQELADARLGLRERLLGRGSDLGDLEDVIAPRRLDRPRHLALRGAEQRLVEGGLLLALGDSEQLPALVL